MSPCGRRRGSGAVKFVPLARGLGESTRVLTRRRLSGREEGKIDSRARDRAVTMPSVGGMRRTRVFGLVKGVDGARVLRSGRLLWLDPGEGKLKKPTGDGEDRLAKPNNSSGKNTKGYSGSNGTVKGKENGWAHNSKPKQEQAVASKAKPSVPTRLLKSSSRDAVNTEGRMFGNVYTRKRKRLSDADGGLVNERQDLSGDYGIQFSRRQRRLNEQQRYFSVFLEGGFSSGDGLGQLLISVLFYMKKVELRLSLLGDFLLSEPVCSAFGSIGIRFSWDPPLNEIGVCKLFGGLQLVPLFKVDFSCIPSCFMYMHLHLVFRVKSLSFEHVNNPLDDDDENDHPYTCLSDGKVDKISIPVKNESSDRKARLQEADTSRSKVAHPSVRASKLVGRSRQLRNNLGSRGIQKTRSSLRRKRAGSHTVGLQNASGSIVIGLAHSGKVCVSHPIVSKNASGRSSITTRSSANGKRPRISTDLGTVKLRSTTRSAVNGKRPRINTKQGTVKLCSTLAKLVQDSVKSMSASPKLSQVSVESNPALNEMADDSLESKTVLVKSELDSVMNSSSCSANLLVIEADRCYRIAGVTIVQEVSNLSEWVLVVKKDGRTFCSHLAQRSMKPCSFNRITHDVIWSTDETWKLEFPNRQDWFIFKDLYKECSDRNVPTTTSKVIPVPGVHEVPDYEDTCGASFCRPDSYLSVNSNEVARALAKKCANYDLDSEDEEWLNGFNSGSLGENESREILSDDKFELMIDAFEKAFYCNPDDFTDEKVAASLCKEIAEKEVVGLVYNYWMKKRKQKRSALLRVFQGHQPKRAPLIPKPAFRKKRSFKRQPSLFGRGKQPSLLQGKLIGGDINNYRFSWQEGLPSLGVMAAAEQDALQEQNAAQKVDKAKESAKRCVESAIEKRQRAQLLMENADLAVYKAVMALKIAESASCTGAAAEVTATCDIDWQT